VFLTNTRDTSLKVSTAGETAQENDRARERDFGLQPSSAADVQQQSLECIHHLETKNAQLNLMLMDERDRPVSIDKAIEVVSVALLEEARDPGTLKTICYHFITNWLTLFYSLTQKYWLFFFFFPFSHPRIVKHAKEK
jgi:hypothetical protein